MFGVSSGEEPRVSETLWPNHATYPDRSTARVKQAGFK